MNRAKVACVVLAAGKSARFAGIKQLATLEGKPLLQRALESANNSISDYVLLIVGAHSDEILGRIATGRAQPILNRDYARGLSTSVKCAISNIPQDAEGALFMVADQPYLHSRQLDDLIRAFRQDESSDVFALAYEGEARNPVLLRKSLFSEATKLEGDVGAREIVRSYTKKIHLVEANDPKVFFDIDTTPAIEKLERKVKN